MKTLKLVSILFVLLFLNACSDEVNPTLTKGNYEKGYFISNEGPFQNGSGSITFVGDDGSVVQNVFKKVNGEDLGNVVISITLAGDHAYIVVNNSHKIVVADRFTMEKITTMEGDAINNPRYLVAKNNKGYISNWGDPLDPDDDFISVIDLQDHKVINTIAVGEGPENMLLVQNNLYVTLEGGWGQNKEVVLIDTDIDQAVKTFTVGDVPSAISADDAGNVWVLCSGKPSYADVETPGSIFKIAVGNTDVTSIGFTATQHPEHLVLDAENLYYNLNDKIYRLGVNATDLPGDIMPDLQGTYYSLNANNGLLFAGDAKYFTSEGELRVYDLASGVLLETFATGIGPGDIAFQ